MVRLVQGALGRIYLGAIAFCVGGIFLLLAIGALAGGPTGSYSMAGNPWQHSGFPWYVQGCFMLGDLLIKLIFLPVGFAAAFLPCFALQQWLVPDPEDKRPWLILFSIAAGVLIEFAVACRLFGWFGLGG